MDLHDGRYTTILPVEKREDRNLIAARHTVKDNDFRARASVKMRITTLP